MPQTTTPTPAALLLPIRRWLGEAYDMLIQDGVALEPLEAARAFRLLGELAEGAAQLNCMLQLAADKAFEAQRMDRSPI